MVSHKSATKSRGSPGNGQGNPALSCSAASTQRQGSNALLRLMHDPEKTLSEKADAGDFVICQMGHRRFKVSAIFGMTIIRVVITSSIEYLCTEFYVCIWLMYCPIVGFSFIVGLLATVQNHLLVFDHAFSNMFHVWMYTASR